MSASSSDFSYKGLTSAEVTAARAAHGPNILTPPRRPSVWRLYLEKWNDPIIRILLVAALLSLGIGLVEHEFVDTIGILIAILLATTVGFYFEWDAAQRFDELNALNDEDQVLAIRDGQVVQVARSELVVGDLVLLEQGMEVPADGLLLQAINLCVDESSLTGETMQHKSAQADLGNTDTAYPTNRVLRSSMILEGRGLLQVDAVGDATEIGQVAREVSHGADVPTPLNQQLRRLAGKINRGALIVSLLVFVLCSATGLVNYYRFHAASDIEWLRVANILLQNFMLCVTLIVMAVPEGLPMTITLSLALNMRRMLRTNNLVRKMHACETMGALTTICTDKTGTLTQNRMEVTHLDCADEELPRLFRHVAANTTAHLTHADEGVFGVGNPTECALLLYMQRYGADYVALRRESHIMAQLPFSPERKFMATLADEGDEAGLHLYLKGAPEVVMALCDLAPQDAEQKSLLLKEYQQSAMRTLAFAERIVPRQTVDDLLPLIEQGAFHLQGLCAISDPVRPEVTQAIATCHRAGIDVKMVTGDNADTAAAVAQQIGLISDLSAEGQQLTGAEFAALSDEEALRRTKQLKILSRARPHDKQRLVELLQQQEQVVAVTGDGTNDAPALHHAQVGLSMGSGTAVAKEASDITLLDDSFRSIVTAVYWGRSLYKNIQRFIGFQLTISLTALLITLVGALIGKEMPLTVTQILWINLIIDTFASMALSTIPPSAEVMQQAPRRAEDFIINRSLARQILTTTALFSLVMIGLLVCFDTSWLRGSAGISPMELTVMFTTFVLLQFWNLLNAKAWASGRSAFSNLRNCCGLLLVMAVIFVGQVLIVQFGGSVFRTVPLSLPLWAFLVLATSLTLWISEAWRLFFSRRKS